VVENFARNPSGNDRDQVKAILAGEGDLAVINTYYLGLLLNSADSQEAQAGEAVQIFWPNQEDRGAHINVSGVGLTANSPNAENAIALIEYMISQEVQELYASANYEYPANPNAEVSDQLKSWGEFKEDELPLARLGELNDEAVIIFDEVGWP
ncbi:MAG: extracellular solute-binding protein, partial [Bacteroidota bacterium]